MTKEIDILLVEDSRDDVELVTRALHQVNPSHLIAVARDGEEALDFLFCRGPFTARPCDQVVKLVLLDLKLPKIDGIEVLEQIKADARTRFIPVVIMTSSRQEEDLVRSYNLGANSYIQKPIDFDEFSRTIATMSLYWVVINQRPTASTADEFARRGRS